MTQDEKALALLYPKEAMIVKDCAAVADEWTNKVFKSYYQDKTWLDGDAANAYRHAMWNALLKQAFSSDANSKLWTDAHEAWPEKTLANGFWNEHTGLEHTAMDLHNNAAGRDAIKWYEFYISEQEISDRILEKMKKGDMVYIVDYGWYDSLLNCESTK